ncbi:DHHC zinc finger domain-containing protein [Toxoplasma gondii TgCatPRC2]|uniref:Palmitoyltransferase n=8 Tax=Toxoplasma gondii TaxID=5811 RepID=S7VPZ0_TOXGG|nr:DHHC zinc finger domain-containing protein [Toxoplasma gondii ME49]EPR57204.1 DHHC zinc finger domain-containing protein [Toxoplasma gondii GT1]KAF4645146.1 DHHC zinc finger domain-containing protein [Toxoplasma gondii]KFG99771.1 DHHC zinc finger domain-containing protein [Toxoplasma gondii VAND]KYF38947.1 DHHC zinc finger domain-containing protein [Toxoplasma gondii ARI]KYK63198.1 DHHC zinc finger domain-containing protein [Toxoplasma gondii TgCatPRC2]PIL96280.1 DHHC zinc finger domain-co|eukprot:XP_018637937.1 DHHC zinc finger domain-containing protein [Toxoplasma gondii ME49]
MWKRESGGRRLARFLPVVVVLMISIIIYSIYLVYNCFPLLQIEVPEEYRDDAARRRGFIHLLFSHLLASLMFWSLFKACVTGAGSVPDTTVWKSRPNTAELVERKRDGTVRYCHKCAHYKPDRAHHSRHTGTCTLKLDHYCPWVANDIGYFNYKYFYLTLLYSTATLSFTSATMFPTVTAAFGDSNIPFETVYFILLGTVLSICVLCIVGSFFIFHTYLLSINSSTVEYCEKRRGGPGHDWDLGVWNNIKEVMGENPLLWLVPVGGPSGDGLMFPRIH